MKKLLSITVALVVLTPIVWIFLYIFFPQVRPEPSAEDLFQRLTGEADLPQSVTNLKKHLVVDPLLGDGTAIISFSISSSEGKKLLEGLTFSPGTKYGTNEMRKPMPIEIENAETGEYREDLREGFVTTNPDRTVILWFGSI